MWLSIVGAVLALLTTIAQGFGSLVSLIRESNLKKQGKEEAENALLKQETEVLGKAIEARQEARIANGAVPESDSLPDDGYRRD